MLILSKKAFLMLAMTLLLTSCSSIGKIGLRGGKGSHGTGEGATYKIGSPYQIDGNWYYPKEDYSYNEVGIASWYGPQFHNKLTANGEIYDMNALTAAHPTLPMPSMVKVTNLQNGRSIVLRINDRGPFAKDRIIDVSKKAAQLLGFLEQGTAKVRVEILQQESIAMKNRLLDSEGRTSPGRMAGGISKVENYLDTPVVSNLPEATPVENYDIWKEPDVVKTQISAPSSFSQVDYLSSSSSSSIASNNATFVQVGAFSSYENASKLSNSLSNLGKVSITDTTVGGQKLYRVRISADNENEAQSVVSRLIDSGHSGAKIVKD